MANILKFFLPKDRVFYSLFEQASQNLESIAGKLVKCVHEADFNKRAVIIKEMEDLEHQNDELTHEIFVELGKNFITPFDREDIHSLATSLDDIADHIYATAKKINFYKVDPNDQGIQKMADAIHDAVLAVNSAVKELRNLKNTQKIVECVIKINSIENQADDIFDLSIEKLFDSDIDAKDLIKKREIYQIMEIATDKCEDAGNVIESIVVKYA
ncbi:MAG: phosphate transport regulator [Crocinitomicaceae bacterium]|jgi:predicted phosphate transport protein (TIGR00153 family)|nr:phosphate transport regulator [Crocinitomicaceae bacterium]